MSILIKGMEMPTEDEEIIIRIDSSGTVMTEYALPISGTKAIPVPPHGRLIDADALIRELEITEEDDHNGATLLMAVFLEVLKSAPTIIPASIV